VENNVVVEQFTFCGQGVKMGMLENLIEGVTRFVLNYCQRQNPKLFDSDRQKFEHYLENLSQHDSATYKFNLEKIIDQSLSKSYKEREPLLLYSVESITQLKGFLDKKEPLSEEALGRIEDILRKLLCNYLFIFSQAISVSVHNESVTLPSVIKGGMMGSSLCLSGTFIENDILIPLGLTRTSSPGSAKKIAQTISYQLGTRSLPEIQRMFGDLLTEVSSLNEKLSKSSLEVAELKQEVSSLKEQTSKQQEKILELEGLINTNNSNLRLGRFFEKPHDKGIDSVKLS
jgi:hypothetical protein